MINRPKIYFAGSIRGGREYADIYARIIKELENYGEVLTEHVGSSKVSDLEMNKSDEDIYNTDMNWLKQANFIVADVSVNSLGVGYELGYASSLEKNVICLYYTKSKTNLSAMITGDKTFEVIEYSDFEDLKTVFKNYFLEK